MAFLAVACANPYARFYQGIPDARRMPNYVDTREALQLYRSDDFERDRLALMRRGYMPIGHASFNARADGADEVQLRDQARQIGAHVVLVASRYTHSIAGAVPLQVPYTTTSHSTGTATAYGGGSSVRVYGAGATTTSGTRTVMMPYTVDRSDFNALFFAKTRGRVGIIPEPIDDETRRRLQTNAGVRVLLVTEGSPAFKADVLPGDIVLSVNGDAVQSEEHYSQLLNRYEGQTVLFLLDRDGIPVEKQIEVLTLGP